LEAGAIPARSKPRFIAKVFKSEVASGVDESFVKIETLIYFSLPYSWNRLC
jgi:hypothetical protein